MAKQDFVPEDDAKFVAKHGLFKTKVAENKTLLGLTDDDVTQADTDNVDISAALADRQLKRSEYRASVRHYLQIETRVEANWRNTARRAKASPNYTEGKGQEMGIEGEDSQIDWSQAEPTLRVKADASGVTIGYNKGESDGINLYERRGNATEFTLLRRITRASGKDMRDNLTPAPEKREYYAIYLLGDDEVGQRSGIVSVTVTD